MSLACASTCNVLFMRFHELYDGIEVIDEENKPIGVSKVAAKKVNILERFSESSVHSGDVF